MGGGGTGGMEKSRTPTVIEIAPRKSPLGNQIPFAICGNRGPYSPLRKCGSSLRLTAMQR
jgi:hypothetical protein